MSRKSKSFLLVVVGSLIAWAAPGAANAVTPSQPQAKVLFSNGGRILEMAADGSDRKVLFGKNRQPANDGLGASDPAVSPDGKKIVFGYRREIRYGTVTDIWIMNSDGTGARRLFKSTPKAGYGDPGFTSGGRIIASLFKQNRKAAQARIFTMEADGRYRQALYVLRQKRRPWVAFRVLAEPALSPNGSRLLYLIESENDGTFQEWGYGAELRVMNLVSRNSRVFAERSLGGSWSPDGRRIVYSEVQIEGDEDFCWNFDYSCSDNSRLRISNRDGSGAHDLTSGSANERKPDWSADDRIVFESTRGKRRNIAETTEVWSVRPGGHCLTRLTNGSPASLAPAWHDASANDTRPASCGAKPPGPNLETIPSVPSSGGKPIWLGPSFRKVLLSYSEAKRGSSFYAYGDCGAIPETGCGREVVIYNEDICKAKGYAAGMIGSGRAQTQRGIWVFRSLKPGRETPPFTLGFTGRTIFFLIGGSGIGDRSRQHRAEINSLRSVGQKSATGDLPAPKFPASDIRTMKRVKRIFERTDSVVRTARLLDRGGYFVRSNLRFARQYEAVGGYESVTCQKR